MFLIVIHFKLFAIVKFFVIKYILKTEIKVHLADIEQHIESYYPTGRINSPFVNRPIRLINVDLEFKKKPLNKCSRIFGTKKKSKSIRKN